MTKQSSIDNQEFTKLKICFYYNTLSFLSPTGKHLGLKEAKLIAFRYKMFSDSSLKVVTASWYSRRTGQVLLYCQKDHLSPTFTNRILTIAVTASHSTSVLICLLRALAIV